MQIVLADREAELMDVLWDHGPSTVFEVQDLLHDALAYNTVLTTLRKLESKGFVGHTEEGRSHRYHALIERGAARQGALEALVARLFKGSHDELLMHMASREQLDEGKNKRVEALLRKQSRRKPRS